MTEVIAEDQDFGSVNYILSQWLKLSLVLHESRQFVGRSYIFRKTKNRQLKNGTQTGTYWRCMKCEEIIKAKGGRVVSLTKRPTKNLTVSQFIDKNLNYANFVNLLLYISVSDN